MSRLPRGMNTDRLSADILWTTVTSFLVLGANIMLAAMLARRGAVEVYEPYNLAKRIGASALPFISLGFTIGLVRHIAATHDVRERAAYTLAAIAMVLSVMGCVILIGLLYPEAISRVLLGQSDSLLLWAIVLYSFALTANALIYSFYRAERRQNWANVTNAIGVGILPVAVVLLAPQDWSIYALLFTVALLILVWNGGQLVWRSVSAIRRVHWGALRQSAATLLSYSLPRIPSGIAVASLMLLPSLFARQAGDVEASTFLLAALAAVQLAGVSVQSIGVVLLPRVSELNARGELEAIRSMTLRAVLGSLVFALFVAPVAAGVMPTLIPVWLGPEFHPAIELSMLSAVMIPAIVVFSVIRSVADGVVRAPVNTYASVAALAFAAAGMALSGADAVLLMAWSVVGWTTVAAIVLVVVVRTLGIRLKVGYPLLALMTGSAVGLAVFGLGRLAGDIFVWQVSLLAGAAIITLLLLGVLAWWLPDECGLRSAVRRSLTRLIRPLRKEVSNCE